MHNPYIVRSHPVLRILLPIAMILLIGCNNPSASQPEDYTGTWVEIDTSQYVDSIVNHRWNCTAEVTEADSRFRAAVHCKDAANFYVSQELQIEGNDPGYFLLAKVYKCDECASEIIYTPGSSFSYSSFKGTDHGYRRDIDCKR